MQKKIKIICRCKNCGKEFVARETTEEELQTNGYQISTTIYLHQCDGPKGKVIGIGEVIRYEEN